MSKGQKIFIFSPSLEFRKLTKFMSMFYCTGTSHKPETEKIQ